MIPLLEQLDEQWARGQTADLAALLRMVHGEDGNDLRVELCAADLEWRWRTGAEKIASKATSAATLPARPHASDYRTLLGELWDDPACRREILEAEWCARSVWGDAPDVDEFASKFSMQPDWNAELAEKLNSIIPLVIAVTRNKSDASLLVHVEHDFVMGRQSVGEPPAPAWLESSRRLVIANADNRGVSREQLRMRRTRMAEVELTNLSRVSPGRFENRILLPGDSMRLGVPWRMTVGELEISIRADT